MKRKQKYKSVVNSYLPGAPVQEDLKKSLKMQKIIQFGLSASFALWITFVSFQIGWGIVETKLTKEIETWKSRAIEAEKVVNEVDKATKEIKNTRKEIEDEKAHELAVKYTASARAFDIPTSYVLACAKMETGFNPDVVGPFQEREDFQIYKPSFARFFPAKDWHDRQKRYVAGLQHYAICVKIAQKTVDDTKTQLLLSLALHNAGYARSNPMTAIRAARLHMKRAKRLKIWEIVEDRGLKV